MKKTIILFFMPIIFLIFVFLPKSAGAYANTIGVSFMRIDGALAEPLYGWNGGVKKSSLDGVMSVSFSSASTEAFQDKITGQVRTCTKAKCEECQAPKKCMSNDYNLDTGAPAPVEFSCNPNDEITHGHSIIKYLNPNGTGIDRYFWDIIPDKTTGKFYPKLQGGGSAPYYGYTEISLANGYGFDCACGPVKETVDFTNTGYTIDHVTYAKGYQELSGFDTIVSNGTSSFSCNGDKCEVILPSDTVQNGWKTWSIIYVKPKPKCDISVSPNPADQNATSVLNWLWPVESAYFAYNNGQGGGEYVYLEAFDANTGVSKYNDCVPCPTCNPKVECVPGVPKARLVGRTGSESGQRKSDILYRLTLHEPNGDNTSCETTFRLASTVASNACPTLSASPTSVKQGDPVKLRWTPGTNVTSFDVKKQQPPTSGTVATFYSGAQNIAGGSIDVVPFQTTDYFLDVLFNDGSRNPNCSNTKTTVTVRPAKSGGSNPVAP